MERKRLKMVRISALFGSDAILPTEQSENRNQRRLKDRPEVMSVENTGRLTRLKYRIY